MPFGAVPVVATSKPAAAASYPALVAGEEAGSSRLGLSRKPAAAAIAVPLKPAIWLMSARTDDERMALSRSHYPKFIS
jgi:hypothetical protein